MSSADKRSTHTDALATLGTIIDHTQKRDAIHLAVIPVVAGMDLMPGDHIGLVNGYAARVGAEYNTGVLGEDRQVITATVEKGLGIVDPFLMEPIAKGETFWLVIYPRQITSLRHVWEHNSFPSEPT